MQIKRKPLDVFFQRFLSYKKTKIMPLTADYQELGL